jgi:hypothetical protein
MLFVNLPMVEGATSKVLLQQMAAVAELKASGGGNGLWTLRQPSQSSVRPDVSTASSQRVLIGAAPRSKGGDVERHTGDVAVGGSHGPSRRKRRRGELHSSAAAAPLTLTIPGRQLPTRGFEGGRGFSDANVGWNVGIRGDEQKSAANTSRIGGSAFGIRDKWIHRHG